MADIDVIAAIGEKDWEAFVVKVMLVARGLRWVHMHVSDGTMGTDQTLTDCSKLPLLASQIPTLSFEAHLLTASPEKYVRPLADAGVKRIVAHVESNDPRRFLEGAKFDEVEVGIALDGATEVEQVEPFLEEVDFVVIMTAEAGATGGAFLPEAIEKIKLVRQNFPDLPIEVEGGITDVTVKSVRDAGATRLVASDYIFKDPEHVLQAIEMLKHG